MAQLYADENFAFGVVRELRQLKHDVLTALEAGLANRGVPDPDHLAFAISQGRAVLTFDAWDYIRLHSRVRPHSGIIVCSDDHDAAALASRIHQAITNCPNLDNQLLRVTRPPTP